MSRLNLKENVLVDNPSQTIVIRTCALDSGSLTADTEIVRISHCGSFKYEGHQYSGCVQSCSTDGCNDSLRPKSTNFVYLIGSLLLIGRFLFNIWQSYTKNVMLFLSISAKLSSSCNSVKLLITIHVISLFFSLIYPQHSTVFLLTMQI